MELLLNHEADVDVMTKVWYVYAKFKIIFLLINQTSPILLNGEYEFYHNQSYLKCKVYQNLHEQLLSNTGSGIVYTIQVTMHVIRLVQFRYFIYLFIINYLKLKCLSLRKYLMMRCMSWCRMAAQLFFLLFVMVIYRLWSYFSITKRMWMLWIK